MAKFAEIKAFTEAHYGIDVPLDYLLDHIAKWVKEYCLQLDPDFQRAHVWTEEQQVKFIEYFLRGGVSGKDFYLNCPGWMHNFKKEMVLVDGKQRLNAITRFLHNEIPAFGSKLQDYTDGFRLSRHTVKLYVANLETRAEVLQWYIDLNSGVAHTPEEIAKVRRMLEELAPPKPPDRRPA